MGSSLMADARKSAGWPRENIGANRALVFAAPRLNQRFGSRLQRLRNPLLLPSHPSSPTRHCSPSRLHPTNHFGTRFTRHARPQRSPLEATRLLPPQVRAISPLRVGVSSAILLTRVDCLAAVPANTLLAFERPPRVKSLLTRARSRFSSLLPSSHSLSLALQQSTAPSLRLAP